MAACSLTPEGTREHGKLATIVAVDVSGYAALAQANQARAVAAVVRLGKRCAKAAKAHGGRVFDTTGDAVTMEFASVAGGLEAAEELARNPDPPIRVGVHLGHVTALPNGDLLGQGVQVATQLQALAAAGGVVISESAVRGLRGPLRERLVAKGEVKFDKIDESIGIFELSQDAEAIARADAAQRTVQAARRTAIAGMAALGAALMAALAWPLLQPPPAPRVAVLSLTAPDGDAALHELAGGVSDDIVLALTAVGVQTTGRAEITSSARTSMGDGAQSGAPFALSGEVERVGAGFKVSLAVAGTQGRTPLWLGAYEGDDARQLRLRAAAQSADVLACGVAAVRARRSNIEAETLTLLMRACAIMREPDQSAQARDALAQVVARDPDFALARAMLGLADAAASQDAPEPMRQQLRTEARDHAERALRADRRVGEGYLALEQLEARQAWGAREGLLQQGLEHSQEHAALNNRYGDLLMQVGRFSDALTYAQRGSELDPLSPASRAALATILAQRGDVEAARHTVEQSMLDDGLSLTRLRIALWSARYDEALALLETPAADAHSSAERRCWRQSVEAMRMDAAARATATACLRNDDLPGVDALMLLSSLGDLDAAFAQAQTRFVQEGRTGQHVLFTPATRAMRQDARFMPLMKDLGLLRYWRLSGRWPDFCREPGLPYTCQAEAIRLT